MKREDLFNEKLEKNVRGYKYVKYTDMLESNKQVLKVQISKDEPAEVKVGILAVSKSLGYVLKHCYQSKEDLVYVFV